MSRTVEGMFRNGENILLENNEICLENISQQVAVQWSLGPRVPSQSHPTGFDNILILILIRTNNFLVRRL